MHRLDVKQRAAVLEACRMMANAWKDGVSDVEFGWYNTTCPAELAPSITLGDFANMLTGAIEILEKSSSSCSPSGDECARDLQIIYDVLGLTPPKD